MQRCSSYGEMIDFFKRFGGLFREYQRRDRSDCAEFGLG